MAALLADLTASLPSAGMTHACILALCTDPCLHPGSHLRARVRPSVLPAAGPSSSSSVVSFGTWLAAGAEWVTIGRYEDDGATLVYVASQDTFYYASPGCVLSQRCPRHTIFVGQFVLDKAEGCETAAPRVLVHDMARLQDANLDQMPPRERYACLQQLAGCLGPLCTVQWAGECGVLRGELASGRFKVPHAVRGVVALTGVPGRVQLMG